MLIAPRLGTEGRDNTAEIQRYGTRRVLAAEQGPFGLALAAVDEAQNRRIRRGQCRLCRRKRRLAGFSPQRRAHLAVRKRRSWQCRADRRAAAARRFWVSALAAVRRPPPRLRSRALCSRLTVCLNARSKTGDDGMRAAGSAPPCDPKTANELADQFVLSSMVLRTHRDKTYPGAMTASLSVPWGNSRDDRGGYHLVWPRDLVQCATALLAFGAEARSRATRCAI